jgi:hypothetical protein
MDFVAFTLLMVIRIGARVMTFCVAELHLLRLADFVIRIDNNGFLLVYQFIQPR